MQPNDREEAVKSVEVEGIYRVSRHSTFMSFALLGIGKLFTRGFMSDIIFWGMFPAFWLVGSLHQDQRLKETMPAEFFEKTSLLPFMAVYEGKQKMDDIKKEFQPKAAAIALIAPFFFL